MIRQIGTHKKLLRLFEPQQPIEEIPNKDAELYPDPDAHDDADHFRNNILSQILTEADNHQILYNQQDQKPEKLAVHITNKEIRNVQPRTTQSKHAKTNHPIISHHQNKNQKATK